MGRAGSPGPGLAQALGDGLAPRVGLRRRCRVGCHGSAVAGDTDPPPTGGLRQLRGGWHRTPGHVGVRLVRPGSRRTRSATQRDRAGCPAPRAG